MSHLSPSDVGSILQGIGSLASAATVGYAAWVASDTFTTWRRQKLAERRIEQAERILTATYNARRALSHIRSAFIPAHELIAAEKYLEESGVLDASEVENRSRLITAQSYYNRLNRTSTDQDALSECLPMAQAIFGEDLESAISTLLRQFFLISVSIDESTSPSFAEDRAFQQLIRADLSSVELPSRPNKMNKAISDQVMTIEQICLPVIRGK